MTTDVVTRWAAALRSGAYVQGHGRLTTVVAEDDRRHCCLGVLCELAVDDGVVDRVVVRDGARQPYVTYRPTALGSRGDLATKFPPLVVVRWADLPDANPLVTLPVDHRLTAVVGRPSMAQLAALNDVYGASFAEIADLVDDLARVRT